MTSNRLAKLGFALNILLVPVLDGVLYLNDAALYIVLGGTTTEGLAD